MFLLKKSKKATLPKLAIPAIPGEGRRFSKSQHLVISEDKFKYSIKIQTKENQNRKICKKRERTFCL